MQRTLAPTRRSRLLGLTLAASLLPALAPAADSAADAMGSFQNQWYLGAGIGRSVLKPDLDGTGFSRDDDRDTGWRLFLGYDLTERFSLEGYFTRLGKAELAPSGAVKYKDYGLSALYYLYKENQPHVGWGVFGRAGIGHMKNDTAIAYERERDNHLMLGAGLEYAFRNGFALRADADFYDTDARLFAINLLKRFGGGQPVAALQSMLTPAPDSDNDGVSDSEDRCPGTPAGIAVDATGCARDTDGDGVPDSRDRCPNSPANSVVNERGCEPDTDFDGVPDLADNCPDTPNTVIVDAHGCERDSDGDGVPDSQDRCYNTPAGTAVDKRGCQLQQSIVLKGVTFATASAELIGDSRQALDEVAATLKRNPALKLEIAGYTDSQGNKAYNVRLSQRRAEAVLNYLRAVGIAADRLVAKGYGPANPIADNATPKGRAANRRVELHIIE